MGLISRTKHQRPAHGAERSARRGFSEACVERLTIACPLGYAEIAATETAVWRVHLTARPLKGRRQTTSHPVLRECARQLQEYFQGKRRRFDLVLELQGTEFERKVWNQLRRVPYGRTASYKDIARAVGRPLAVRAVGAANGKNPLAVLVPCHRVIGLDGTLVGYGSGLWRKKWLLDHERRMKAARPTSRRASSSV